VTHPGGHPKPPADRRDGNARPILVRCTAAERDALAAAAQAAGRPLARWVREAALAATAPEKK
jgi:uncharacterized protein (DUF1778 family)